MPNPYPVALRERAVGAYEDSTETYQVVATRFAISVNALVRWVQRARTTGEMAPRTKAGGWRSPVDLDTLHRLVGGRPDRTTDELTFVLQPGVRQGRQHHVLVPLWQRPAFERVEAPFVFELLTRGALPEAP